MKEIDVDINLRVYQNYRPKAPEIVENSDNPIANKQTQKKISIILYMSKKKKRKTIIYLIIAQS